MNRDRDEHRDERLGAALRDLPVPEHRRGFWDDLDSSLADENPPAVVRLDEQRDRRRRMALPFAAAAAAAAVAVVVVVAAAGLVSIRSDGDRRDVEVADDPGAGRAAEAVLLTVSYEETTPELGRRAWELAVADDGSFRWTAGDGTSDLAYDAATGEFTEVSRPQGQPPKTSRGWAYSSTGVAPGGPGVGVPLPDPLGAMADFVTALGRTGDDRVADVDSHGRPAWRYDGPVAVDRLGPGSPDHAVVTVDRATGVVLSLRLTSRGRPYQELEATGVKVSDDSGDIDRSRFHIDPPADLDASRHVQGAAPVPLERVGERIGYDHLVPGFTPEGFRLDGVTINETVPAPTGPEGMNPPVTDVVTMRWRDGFHAFTVTLRPQAGGTWDDPFGMEGFALKGEPVFIELSGRRPLEGQIVVAAPARPHLWGITGDVVVTIDGDLGAEELRQVAATLSRRSGPPAFPEGERG